MAGDISAGLVKQLRDRTGVGFMDCKRALVESGGDLDAAVELLRKSSKMAAEKKSGRIAAEGLVLVRTQDSTAVLIEVNSETDFVARDEHFVGFAEAMLEAAISGGAGDAEGLMQAEQEERRLALVQKLGENIQVRRLRRFTGGDRVGAYTHSNRRIASAVSISGGDDDLARGLAMHVAAGNPLTRTADEVDAEILERERSIFRAQAEEEGKPPEIAEKMVEGRLRKFLGEVCMVDQPYVLDTEKKVGQVLQAAGAELLGFVRFEVGEGIERADTDFVAEVQAQLQS
ncbi:MAG: elongation factor Ts [Gammaproteobacteria bacterium AqS3]|nr:elongation factor Ts [Gammaproteobacteria bacterium AqS3]